MKSYIYEVRKFISPNVCEKVISYFDQDYNDAKVTGSKSAKKDIRNCVTRTILDNQTFGSKLVANHLQKKVFELCQHYKKIYPYFSITRISQFDILRYDFNEHPAGYTFHTDMGSKATERSLSISISLNNTYEGGEFVFDFPEGQIEIAQNEGDAIAFPSNFMFPHQVNKITKGTRYALIAWVV